MRHRAPRRQPRGGTSRRGLLGVTTLVAAIAGVLGWRMRGGADSRGDEPVTEPALLAALAAWTPARATTPAGRALGYLWAAPNTLVGLAVAATCRGSVRRVEGALAVCGARGPLGRMLARRGFSATTLGHVIIARGEPSPALLAHELCHTRQAERLGVAFGPAYLALLAVYGYRRHPMDRAARAAAQRASDPGPASGSSVRPATG